jgi:large subunit ribosomal protein L47
MARIKAVINERRLAYEGAVKIAEQQREEHYDKVVLNHQAAQFKAERKYLQRRREYEARKEAKQLKLQVVAQNTLSDAISNVPPEHIGNEATEEPPDAEAKKLEVVASTEEIEPDIPLTQPKAVDAAKAGMSGNTHDSSNRP